MDGWRLKTIELNHVAIHVADVAVSARFYEAILQLEPLSRPNFTFPGAWFRLGTSQELHLIGDRAAAVHSSNRGNHFALRVDDLETWQQHLEKTGASFAPPKLRPDGARQIFLRDPDGHVIELFVPSS